jgi:hypothetical protein
MTVGNINDTSDLDKPISTATQAALTALDGRVTTLEGGGGGGGSGDVVGPVSSVDGYTPIWSGTGGDTLAGGYNVTTYAKTLLDDVDAAAMRTTLGLAIGSNVQGYTSVLAATTASFLTADETKLDGIEANADVTDATNVGAAGAFMKSTDDLDDITDGASYVRMLVSERTKVGHLTVTQAVDLDAIETRVNALDAAVILKGTWDASAGTFPGSGAAQAGESWIISVAGTVNSVAFAVGDRIIAITDNASTSTFASNWFKADYTDQVLTVAGLTGSISDSGLRTALGLGALALKAQADLAADVTGDLPFANLTQIAARSVLGVAGDSTADVAAITAANDGEVLRRNGTSIGFGTLITASYGASTITLAKIANGTALSVLGVTGNAGAAYADIVAGSDGHVLRRSGSTVVFATIATASIADNAVTLAKLATIANNRVLGNISGGAAIPAELTIHQLLGIAPKFSANKNGTNQTGVADGVATKLTFGTEARDVGSYFDTTNSRWTPPAGDYAIGGFAYVSSSTGSVYYVNLSILKNGSTVVGGSTLSQVGLSIGVGILPTFAVVANGTDYFELFITVFHAAGGVAVVDGTVANTQFYGWTL